MTDPPVFSKLEADRILRRAAEIDGSDETRHLTAKELRFIAREAGFATEAVERAIAETREVASAATRRAPVQKWGIVVTHLSTVREIPIGIGSEELMRVVKLFHPYREGPPQVKLEEYEVTWRDRKGIRFAITSAGGVTEIRVSLSKFLIRRGRWMGWVKSAADRLEMLVWLVADQEGSTEESPGPLPSPRPSASRQES